MTSLKASSNGKNLSESRMKFAVQLKNNIHLRKECLTSGKVNKLWPFPDRNTQERVLKSFSITKEIAAIKVKRFRKYCRNKACAEDVKLAIIKDLRELMDMGANLKELTVLLSQAELVEAVKEISALKGRKAHQQDSKIAI